MTPQERDALVAFLDQMAATQTGQKDAEADGLIRAAAARQPDSAYLLVQRAMGLDFAVRAAQAEIARLQGELEQARAQAAAPTSFLAGAGAWGRHAAPMPGGSPVAAPAAAPRAVSPAPAPGYAPAQAPASSWSNGLLGSVAATAAGVVAGSFLYQGIQNLMGHHPHQTAMSDEPPRHGLTDPSPVAPRQAWSDAGDAGGGFDQMAAIDDDGDDYADEPV
jgi:hypothetical protein